MSQSLKQLPLSVVDFSKLIEMNFYYVDKTDLITDLLTSWSDVTLFTRPRRFGKTLNMSMLEAFFSPDSDKGVFEGLKISYKTDLCKKFMGKYPVISLSFKDIDAVTYESARESVARLINKAARRFGPVLLSGGKLQPEDINLLSELMQSNMSESALFASLDSLSELVSKHYGNKVVILIDEYDVPLAKSYEAGYYDRMVVLIRNIFSGALKDNPHLQLAVLTGCLRISKESLFTGLNNIRVKSMRDNKFAEYFGFTDSEVRSILEYYGLSDKYEMIKSWYDGYTFGNKSIYCPWDVINYCSLLVDDHDELPQNFWANSSGNDALKRFIELSDENTRYEFESLVNGEAIEKDINFEMTYPEMYSSINNMWSLLYFAGYLTVKNNKSNKNGIISSSLVIPNQEVLSIFTGKILDLFFASVHKDFDTLAKFTDALYRGDVSAIENILGVYLERTVSVRDTCSFKYMKENFYHGFLAGILKGKSSWNVFTNRETGNGYCDVLVSIERSKEAILIETKFAEDGKLDAACQRAVNQIKQKRYVEGVHRMGFKRVIAYGIAFYCKECKVMLIN